ncbi:unnamed protein product [Linum trigynum]|uniref:Ubiquitin-like protease family profile domain-containing protein n=1 Tax=Linum trigynum TaxID=586398 RepID=A0AAV2CIS8_9ROSI
MNGKKSDWDSGPYKDMGEKLVKFVIAFCGWTDNRCINFDEFTWEIDLGFKQSNDTSCGVYALNFMEFWQGTRERGWKTLWDNDIYINMRRAECCRRLLLDEANLKLPYLTEQVEREELLQIASQFGSQYG